MQHRGHDHLDRGDVLAHLLVVVVFVDRPCGVEHHQPELQQLGIRIGDVTLHELLLRQAAALGLSAQRTLAHHVQGLACQPDGAHRVMDTPAAEAGLCDHERLALTAEQRVGGHPHVVVVDEGVRASPSGSP